MKLRKTAAILLALLLAVSLAVPSFAKGLNAGTGGGSQGSTEPAGIDYLVLVNKLNALPEGWEDALDIVHMNNSLGDDVEVERAAYDAYLQLKEALAGEGVYIDLDSARRSVAVQQDIMDRFIEKYGAEYAAKTVAKPGFSEHHTGLALDLYLNIDGEDVYYSDTDDSFHIAATGISGPQFVIVKQS